VVTELGISMLVRLEQPSKAYLPMLVTELGILVFLHPTIKVFVAVSMIALQFPRESYLGLPSSTMIVVRFSQSSNTLSPKLVTELPIFTLVRLEQPSYLQLVVYQKILIKTVEK